MRGKVISGIAKRNKPQWIPLLVLVGGIAEDAGAGYDLGVTAMFSIDRSAQDFQMCIRDRSSAICFAAMSLLMCSWDAILSALGEAFLLQWNIDSRDRRG